MDTYFIFSDECGAYQETRSLNFKKKHPFYVRGSILVSAKEYQVFEKNVMDLKKKLVFPAHCEIKWSHLGDIRNGRAPEFLEKTSLDELKIYIREFLCRAMKMDSLRFVFTVTDNNSRINVKSEKVLVWHLQNGLQRFQMDLEKKNGYGIVIIDDLNDKNKSIKETCYKLMCQGDFVRYDNMKQSILVDYSNQCVGLQLADIVVGAFTSAMIGVQNGKGYPFALELYADFITQKIRTASNSDYLRLLPYESMGLGLISIPNENCRPVLESMNKIVGAKEYERLCGDGFMTIF